MMHYRTGLVLGRAYALADAPRERDERSALELCQLARQDGEVLELAEGTCREALSGDPHDPMRRRAVELIGRARQVVGEAGLVDVPPPGPDRGGQLAEAV